MASVEQAQAQSLDVQHKKCWEYAKRNGMSVIKKFLVVGSTGNGNRGMFKEMLKFVKSQKEPVAIITCSVDRLHRNFKESLLLNPLIEKGKLEIHFIDNESVIRKNPTTNDLMLWDFNVVEIKAKELVCSEGGRLSI